MRVYVGIVGWFTQENGSTNRSLCVFYRCNAHLRVTNTRQD